MEVAEIHICTKPTTGPSITKLEVGFAAVDISKSYILRSATGLSPDEIMSQYYGRAGGTLTKYYKPTMKERVVTLLLNLNPQYHLGESVSSLRDNIYKTLSYGLTAELQLKFVNSANAEIASLFGFIEKIDAGIFSKDSQVQITFRCTDPFLRLSTYVNPPGTFTGLEFNWVDSISNAPHGYIMAFKFLNGGGPFTIINATEFGNAPFYVNFSFLPDDVLNLCSEDTNKYIYVTRPLAGDLNLANYIDPLSIWPVMYPGSNRLTFSTASTTTGSSIQHKPSYCGI
jgi:hypothetical protein